MFSLVLSISVCLVTCSSTDIPRLSFFYCRSFTVVLFFTLISNIIGYVTGCQYIGSVVIKRFLTNRELVLNKP
jgi:hypothetical protein